MIEVETMVVGGTDDWEMVDVVTATSLVGAVVGSADVLVVGGADVVVGSVVVGAADVVVVMSAGVVLESTAEVAEVVRLVTGVEVDSVLGTADVSDMATAATTMSIIWVTAVTGSEIDRDAGTCDAVRRARQGKADG